MSVTKMNVFKTQYCDIKREFSKHIMLTLTFSCLTGAVEKHSPITAAIGFDTRHRM